MKLEEKQREQEAPAGLGSPLLQAPNTRTSWSFFDSMAGGCSVHAKRDESLRSLMKGHSILRFCERHLFLQQNNFIAEVPLAAVTTDLTGYPIYQGYRSDWEGIVDSIIQVKLGKMVKYLPLGCCW